MIFINNRYPWHAIVEVHIEHLQTTMQKLNLTLKNNHRPQRVKLILINDRYPQHAVILKVALNKYRYL